MKKYRCLYNLDMSVIPLCLSRHRNAFEGVFSVEHVREFVRDAAGTGVDAFLCCPTLLRLPLWHSREDPHWKETAPLLQPPTDRKSWTPSERGYYPMREYILAGGNPVQEVYDAVRETEMAFFFSYRMNDWHFVEFDDYDRYPTLDRFYVEHPEYRIGYPNNENPVGWDIKNSRQQNYRIPDVRRHYLALLTELAEQYDIDGLELDLMRSPNYFPLNRLEEGTAVMSDFVRTVRTMLDRVGLERGKTLPLCVRVPHRYAYCARIGLDVKGWVENGWVQMVNVSSSYFHTEALEIEAYRKALPGARIYGEEQMVMNNAINRYGWPSERRTPTQVLETTAHAFWCRGADGISLYNFPFTREIDQPVKNPDSVYTEPPKEVLLHLADEDYLKTCPKHYFSYGYSDLTFDGKLPAMGTVTTTLRIWDDPSAFRAAALRVVCSGDVRQHPKRVRLNGVRLEETGENDELFPETVREGQFPPEQTFNLHVPIEALAAENRIEITLNPADIEIFGLELALYRNQPGFNK